MVMATGGMGMTRNIQPYDPTQQQTLGGMARGQYGRGQVMPQQQAGAGMTWSMNGDTGQWQQVPTSSIMQPGTPPPLPAGTSTSMGGAMPQGPSMPTRSAPGGIPPMTGNYTTDLAAYRAANKTSDNMDWIKQLAPEQQQWMQQNPGMGDNPTGPGLQPFGAPPPGGGQTNQQPSE